MPGSFGSPTLYANPEEAADKLALPRGTPDVVFIVNIDSDETEVLHLGPVPPEPDRGQSGNGLQVYFPGGVSKDDVFGPVRFASRLF